jgi:hypothetical protein
MPDSNEPKKETVRIALPSQPVTKGPGVTTKSRDAVRIQLPPRQPSNNLPLPPSTGPSVASEPVTKAVLPPQFPPPPPPPPPASTLNPPIVSMPVPASAPTVVTPAPDSPPSSPKKETARIPLMPDPPARPVPTVQMKKTQPLIAMPQSSPQTASIAIAPTEKSAIVHTIPMPICWGVLGISALILIMQIWIYFS